MSRERYAIYHQPQDGSENGQYFHPMFGDTKEYVEGIVKGRAACHHGKIYQVRLAPNEESSHTSSTLLKDKQ